MTASNAALPWSSPLKPLIEAALERFLPATSSHTEALHRALRYAVFSDGKRLRPQFLLHVAQACGASPSELELAMRAACAVELVHIATLVHDDLPCFDNAPLRRGRLTVHALFGEARALLVGDALLAHSFELLMGAPRAQAARALRIGQLLARAASSACGLTNAPGLEPDAPGAAPATESAAKYHAMKTGALFAMAAESGAIAAGSRKTEGWARIGRLVSEGYQLAHTLQALPPSAAPHAGSTMPAHLAPSRPQAVLQQQISALLASLHTQIQALATRPEPLIEFLDRLGSPLLQSGELASTAPARPDADKPERAEPAPAFIRAAPPAK